MDPIQRARERKWERRGEDQRDRRARQAQEQALAYGSGALGRSEETYVDSVATLPETGTDQTGRLVYVRNDGAEDVLSVSILDADGNPAWVGISLVTDPEVTEVASYKWSTPKTGAARAAAPQMLAMRGTTEVLVPIDYGSPDTAVRRYNAATGAYIGDIGSYGTTGNTGQLEAPNAVAVSASGNIYVTDRLRNRVVQYNSSRDHVRNFGSTGSGNGDLSSPHGIAIDASNNVYVADYDNSRVSVFSSTGTWSRHIGTTGGSGKLSYPLGLAINSLGELIVASAGNSKIKIYTASNGTWLRSFGSHGSAPGQFSSPRGVAVDATDRIYVADRGNNRVQRFVDGAVDLTWGQGTENKGDIKSPFGVACSGADVFVSQTTDVEPRWVQKFSIIPRRGVEMSKDGVFIAAQPGINVIGGTGVTVTATDDATNQRSNVTISGYSPTVQRVVGTSQNITPSNNTATATVSVDDCTGGAAANWMIGGGCNTSGAQHRLRGSYPSSATDWYCESANESTTNTYTLTPYIICLRKT